MPHTPFSGSIPDDLLYYPDHDMWVRELPDGEVLIGATAFGIHLAGEIIAFTSKPNGAEVARGRGMGTVECRKTVLALHAPLSFVLIEGNEAAEERPKLVNRDPYGEGWMARGRPQAWVDERGLLIDAAAYRAHVLKIDPEASLD
jgi:glycine cleavage system H protein